MQHFHGKQALTGKIVLIGEEQLSLREIAADRGAAGVKVKMSAVQDRYRKIEKVIII